MAAIRAGAGISSQTDPRRCVEQAVEQALAGAGERVDGAFLFATGGHGEALPGLLDTAVAALGSDVLVGASAHGVLAGGRDCEDGPAVAVLAWSGLECLPFLIRDLDGDETVAGGEVAARLGGEPRADDLVVLLPDPRTLDSEPLLEGVRSALGPAQVVGAGAADAAGTVPLQWCGREVETGALAGMVLRGGRPARVGVTQACRPVTPLMTVTRARANWILELDGRPALEVYREVARGPLAEDLRRAASFVLVALPRDPEASDALDSGSYLVRHAVGFAPEHQALALPEMARSGQRVAFALRDPASAREDLKAVLEGLAGERPGLGLYFNCCARGSSLFGIPGLEAGYLERAFGDVAVAGPFGSCEIGPVGGRTELLTYTGVLALVDG